MRLMVTVQFEIMLSVYHSFAVALINFNSFRARSSSLLR